MYGEDGFDGSVGGVDGLRLDVDVDFGVVVCSTPTKLAHEHGIPGKSKFEQRPWTFHARRPFSTLRIFDSSMRSYIQIWASQGICLCLCISLFLPCCSLSFSLLSSLTRNHLWPSHCPFCITILLLVLIFVSYIIIIFAFPSSLISSSHCLHIYLLYSITHVYTCVYSNISPSPLHTYAVI